MVSRSAKQSVPASRRIPKVSAAYFIALTVVILFGATVVFHAAGCGKPPPPTTPPPKKKQVLKKKPKKKIIPRADEDIPAPECAERDKQLADLYAPYMDAFSNHGISVSPDGKTLLFKSNRGGGSPQLYVAPFNKPRATPVAIARAKDGVQAARFTPDGKYILFIRDKNRNENTQIFRASVDGKEVVPLTKNPGRFHHLPLVTADGQTLLYMRGKHKKSKYVLVTQSIDGGKARVVKAFKGFHVLSDISPDGKRALVFELKSLSESRLHLVELAGKSARAGGATKGAATKGAATKSAATKGAAKKGRAKKGRAKKGRAKKGRAKKGKAKKGRAKKARAAVRRLAPTKGKKAHAHRAIFSTDGKSVLVVTDEGGDRAGLHRLELSSGKVTATYYDKVAEVADVEASRKAPLVAVLLNMGSHQAVKLLDAATLKEKARVKVPMGGVSLGRFTSNGAGVVLTLSIPSAPTDVFMLSTKNGRLKALRKDKRKGLRKLAKVKATTLRIPSFDKLQVPINVYLPRRLPRRKRLPVMVWVHGGPASQSSIRWSPLIGFWVARGFAVVAPNVRGSTGFGKEYERADNGKKRMDAIKDLAQVNRWVREQPWADPARLVVGGGSYGGYMTYMGLGHQPDLWRAGVGMVGVVNLKTFLMTTTGAIRLAFREEFGQLPGDRKFLRSVSPISVVKQIKAPLFVYQGQNDPRVPRSEQDQLVNALRKAAVPVEYMVAADEGHSLSQRHNKLQFISRSMRFLEQHMDLPGVPKDCKEAARAQQEEAGASGEASAGSGVKKSGAKTGGPGGGAKKGGVKKGGVKKGGVKKGGAKTRGTKGGAK